MMRRASSPRAGMDCRSVTILVMRALRRDVGMYRPALEEGSRRINQATTGAIAAKGFAMSGDSLRPGRGDSG